MQSLNFACFVLFLIGISTGLGTGQAGFYGTLLMWFLFGPWIDADNRKTKVISSSSLGIMIYAFSPIFLPYYLIKTRGWRGGLSFLGVCGLYYLGCLFGGIAHFYLLK